MNGCCVEETSPAQRWYGRIVMDGSRRSVNLLFVLALATDLVTPVLIWKGILPSYTRWISHAAVIAMILGAYARMMVYDRVPGSVWIMAWISIVGTSVALLRGQGLSATIWGSYILLQWPLVGLYAYLERYWPRRFAQRLRAFCLAVLGAELAVQVGQYLGGERPGDNLAGTLGWHGTGHLETFILLVTCLALGQWLASQEWTTLIWTLALGSASSVLGEMKLFPFALLALAAMSAVIFVVRGGQLRRLAPFAVLFCVGLVVFVAAYDVAMSPTGGGSFGRILDPRFLADYLGGAERVTIGGRYLYDIGRNYALAYGWNEIRRDATTLLFGMGLGARGESNTLSTAGVALLEGRLGLSTGTSLLVMMQELGLVGMAVVGGSGLWIVAALWRGIRNDPQSEAAELRYGLLLFTLLWPLWLWYGTVWYYRVPMLLYWVALGYVLSEPWRSHLRTSQPPPDTVSLPLSEDIAQ
jgi:hypothetical protein